MKKILTLIAFFVITNSFAQTTEVIPPPPPPPPPPFEKRKVSKEKYKKDTTKNSNEEDLIFQKVEVESEFEGGSKAWRDFLVRNLNVDVALNKKAKPGTYTVIVRFIVGRDGAVSNINIEANPGYGTGEEVIRVMKLSPKWKPGFQNGVPVSSIKRQPISFIVSNN